MLTFGERLAAIPLMILPVGAYAALAELSAGAHARLDDPLIVLPTRTSGPWPVSAADLLIAASLVVFFLELFKAMATRRLALVNRVLALLLFAGCLAAMLLLPGFASSAFFLITLMVLLDAVAGFVATGRD